MLGAEIVPTNFVILVLVFLAPRLALFAVSRPSTTRVDRGRAWCASGRLHAAPAVVLVTADVGRRAGSRLISDAVAIRILSGQRAHRVQCRTPLTHIYSP